MAKSAVIKTFSFQKLARKLDPIFIESLNEWGRTVNKDIQDGIDNGKDLQDKKFKRISSKTTKPIRARKSQGSQPLKISGNMKKTKLFLAKPGKISVEIEIAGKSKRTKKKYGAYQHTGFTNSDSSAFPGTKVPARKWFGVSKRMAPGSAAHKKMVLKRSLRIRRAFKK